EVRTPTLVNQYVVNQYHVHPGIAGGRSGSPDRCTLRVGGPPDEQIVVDPSVAGVRLETGEQLVYDFGGGGGWGDALARDPEAVLDDVWDEYVSIEGAARDYGVVITGSLEACTLALDLPATAALRAAKARASESA
ncbi:MAG TPA: hydantoinase B/oxoprolinase family protein, partial [Acidimicrobiia bacterium]